MPLKIILIKDAINVFHSNFSVIVSFRIISKRQPWLSTKINTVKYLFRLLRIKTNAFSLSACSSKIFASGYFTVSDELLFLAPRCFSSRHIGDDFQFFYSIESNFSFLSLIVFLFCLICKINKGVIEKLDHLKIFFLFL